IAVSAVTGHGLAHLLDEVDAALSANATDMELLVPFDRGDVVDLIHRIGEILSEVHDPDGTRIKARIPTRHTEVLSAFEA
ncbi:MAG TPA: GTPase HflX, partial [Acidimicrobiia bacterium]|nr:GTPase HflX [Acidimicrobiia bacterium]